MSRRRRNRRQRQRQRRRDQDVPDRALIDKYVGSRTSVRQGFLETEHGRGSIEESDGQKRAREAQRKQRIAFVSNLSYSCSVTELVEWLGELLGHPEAISRCEIQRDRDGYPAGRALVTFVDPAAFERLSKLCKTEEACLHGRPLRCKQRQGQQMQQQRTKDAGLFAISAKSLCLASRSTEASAAVAVAEDATTWSAVRWCCTSTSTTGVRLEIDGRNRRQMAIEFGEEYRVEFALKQVSGVVLFSSNGSSGGSFIDNERMLLRIRLVRPPQCFRANVENGPVSVLHSLTTSRDRYVWDRYEAEAASAAATRDCKWERTVDPSGCPSNPFGHCLDYELVIAWKDADALRSRLAAFSLRLLHVKVAMPETLPADSALLLLPGGKQTGGDDWSGGFDRVFADLFTFDVTYLLHALIASHALRLGTVDDAECLARCLEALLDRHGKGFVLDVLEEWFAAPRGRTTEPAVKTLKKLAGDYSSAAEIHGHDEAEENDQPGQPPMPLTRRVLVTPLRVCPQPPEPDMDNRVLRAFPEHRDRFVRVSFVDENFGSILGARSDDVFEKRIRRLIHDGVVIGGRRFAFLAYSNSQLREQSCWMYDESDRSSGGPAPVPSAADIRASIGDLSHIRIVGKHAARLGQAFSSTTSAMRLTVNQTREVADIERNGFCFSDGVGCISPELAGQVHQAMRLQSRGDDDGGFGSKNTVPSAFQIRFGGSKGVVAVNPLASGLWLRKSMLKFEANGKHRDLEICSVSKYMPCYLNRQIIMILSALGIGDRVFERLLDRMIQHMDLALESSQMALVLASEHAGSGSLTLRMLEAGLDVRVDRHLRGLVLALRDKLLVDLQLKARIFVPDGIVLIGVVDETDTLDHDSIFFQSRNLRVQMPPPGTRVAVGRSPCLHPGDIRVLTLVEAPQQLHHLFDVVVFSAKGERPQPNKMSGGDLDGDIYFVIWDQDLVPQRDFPAMDFTPPPTPTARYDVSAHQIGDFFVDYMKNDNLGMIANAHVVFADFYDDGVCSPDCIELAGLHSMAVDFAKTGVAASVPKRLRAHVYPDFMAKENVEVYQSKKILGTLYRRSVKMQLTRPSLDWTRRGTSASNGFDRRLVLPGYEHFLAEAQDLHYEYIWELWEIARNYEVWDEAELVSGFVRQFSRKVSRSRKGVGDAVARLNLSVQDLQSYFHQLFWQGLDREGYFERRDRHSIDHALQKASAWYVCAYTDESDDSGYLPYLSFAWIAASPMCMLVRLMLGNAAS